MFTPLLLSLSPVPSGSVSSTVSILNLFLAFLSFTHFSFHHVVFFGGVRSQKPSITMPRCCTFIQPSFKVVYSAPAGLKIGLIIQKPLRFFVYQTTAGGWSHHCSHLSSRPTDKDRWGLTVQPTYKNRLVTYVYICYLSVWALHVWRKQKHSCIRCVKGWQICVISRGELLCVCVCVFKMWLTVVRVRGSTARHA